MVIDNSVVISRIAMVSAAIALLICVTQVAVSSAGSESLHDLGIGHVDIIGTRVIDEHHNIHDYPGSDDSSDKSHKNGDSSDKSHKSDSSDSSEYHNPIYDYADHSKDDYSKFGDKESHDDSHEDSHKSDDKSHS